MSLMTLSGTNSSLPINSSQLILTHVITSDNMLITEEDPALLEQLIRLQLDAAQNSAFTPGPGPVERNQRWAHELLRRYVRQLMLDMIPHSFFDSGAVKLSDWERQINPWEIYLLWRAYLVSLTLERRC